MAITTGTENVFVFKVYFTPNKITTSIGISQKIRCKRSHY